MNKRVKKKTSNRGKNLKKVGYGSVENQWGVRITKKEQKEIKSLVAKANRTREKMLKFQDNLEMRHAGKLKGVKYGDIYEGLRPPSDFIIQKKSASLQVFRTKKGLQGYIKHLKKVTSDKYIKNTVKQLRASHIKAIQNTLGSQPDLVKMIKNLSVEQYYELYLTDDCFTVQYVYDLDELDTRVKNIKNSIKGFMEYEKKYK